MSCVTTAPAIDLGVLLDPDQRPQKNGPPRTTYMVAFASVAVCLGGVAAMGHTPARIGAACAVMGGLWGFWDGAFRHMARWCWLVLAFAAAGAAATQLGPAAAARFGLSPWIGILGAGTLAWGAVGCACRIFTAIVHRRCIRNYHARRTIDRVAGLLIGAAAGAASFLVAAWMLSAFSEPLMLLEKQTNSQTPPALVRAIQQVRCAQLALEHDPVIGASLEQNPLKKTAPVALASNLAAAISDPAAMERLMNEPRVRSALEDPVLRDRLKVFSQPGPLREALKKRDYAALLQDPSVQALLTDEQFRSRLWEHFSGWSPAVSAELQPPVISDLPPLAESMRGEDVALELNVRSQPRANQRANPATAKDRSARQENYIRPSR